MPWSSVVLCIFAALQFCLGETFDCQDTVGVYNSLVNTGNFSGAAALTLAENVTYIIPGDSSYCPYSGTYAGRDKVVELFEEGFLGHFTIVNPLVNMRALFTNANEGGSIPELINFNDESFRVLPKFIPHHGRSSYFRVPVIHDFLFDDACKITQMHLYHDPYICAEAFAGHSAVLTPIWSPVTINPPALEYQVTAPALNWAAIPGTEKVNANEARKVAMQYYTAVAKGDLQNIDKYFIALDYSLPQQMAAIYVPGDPAVLPYAGLWLDSTEVLTYHITKAAAAKENNPSNTYASNVTSNGNVLYQWRLEGNSLTHEKGKYAVDAVDYFQMIEQNGKVLIARLTRYFNTWDPTLAGIPSGNPFPQYSSFTVF